MTSENQNYPSNKNVTIPKDRRESVVFHPLRDTYLGFPWGVRYRNFCYRIIFFFPTLLREFYIVTVTEGPSPTSHPKIKEEVLENIKSFNQLVCNGRIRLFFHYFYFCSWLRNITYLQTQLMIWSSENTY